MNSPEDPYKEMLLAFAKESVSAARNRLYAALAGKAGDESTARMLHALADSEEVHARRIMMHLRGKIGADVDEHLDALVSTKRKDFTVEFLEVAEILHREGRETFTVEFLEVAEILHREGRETAAEAFEQFGETAKTQFELLNRRRKDPSAADKEFFVCQVCGYIAQDHPPKNCPVCHAVESKFRKPE